MLAARGTCNLDRGEEAVSDPAVRERLKRAGASIRLRAAAIAALAALAAIAAPM